MIPQGLTTITDCIDAWWSALPSEEKAIGFDEMVSCWGSTAVVSKLSEKYFDQIAELARWVKGAASLAYSGKRIKTVLAYYERARDGGTERVASLLCQIWVDMGFRVILVTVEEATAEDYPLPDQVERVVLRNHAYSDYAKGKNYRDRAEEWTRILQDYEVDAVVYHAYWNTRAFFWDTMAIKTNGVAVIGFWHNTFSCGRTPGWEKVTNYFAPCELTDALMVLSDTDHAFLRYFNGNIHVTLNPLTGSLENWKRERMVEKHDILWLARLAPPKRPWELIPIMRAVLTEVPDAVLHIVGRSQDGKMEKVLERKIKEAGLEGHVKLEGFSTDVKHWYSQSRVFLMTSEYEGYPMTLIESKMWGLPCVMYELPYLTLCEGNRGILPVPQCDTKAAAKAIVHLLKDDAFCEQCGNEARAHIEELAQFDFQKKWREVFKTVEEGYQECVSPAEKRMMDMLIREYVKERESAEQAEKWNRELRDIRQGYSFRIGRIVTWLPRKVRGGLKCLQQHGVLYTARRVIEHAGIDMGTGDFAKRK